MSKKTKRPVVGTRRNPVARHANLINRPATFQDATRYRRNTKHKGTEPFASPFPLQARGLQKVSP